MSDQNECRFSGTVESFQVLDYPPGPPVVRFFLLCGPDRISVIFHPRHRSYAHRLAQCARLRVSGRIRSDSWDGTDGVRRYSWKVIATEVKPIDEEPTKEEDEK